MIKHQKFTSTEHIPMILRNACRVALCACLLIIAWLALSQKTPSLVSSMWDKSNHALAFFVLQFLAGLGWPEQSFWKRAGAIFCFGCLIEFLQAMLPYRTSSAWDILANSLGLLAAELCLSLLQKWLSSSKQDQRIIDA